MDSCRDAICRVVRQSCAHGQRSAGHVAPRSNGAAEARHRSAAGRQETRVAQGAAPTINMSSNHLRRVLALEVRSRAFACVLVEGPHELLDWSVRSFRGGVNAVRVPAGKKIADLLSEYCPDVVLVRVAKDAHGKPLTCDVTDALRKSGHRAVRFVDPQAVRRFFARSDQTRNKYDIAAIVARRFPEIALETSPETQSLGKRRLSHRALRCCRACPDLLPALSRRRRARSTSVGMNLSGRLWCRVCRKGLSLRTAP